MAAGDVTVNLTNPKARRCAVFDGVNDYVMIDQALKDYTSKTITFWAKAEGNTSTGFLRLFSDEISANNGNFLFIRQPSNNRVILGSYDGANKQIDISNVFYENTWYHFTAVLINGSNISLYQNGVQLGSSLSVGNINSYGSSNLHFGKVQYGSSSFFKGSIADVRIYNKVLSTDQIESLYNGADITDGIIARYKLSTDYNDSVGSNNGTNDGSVLKAIDDQVSNVISNARTTANDKFFINEVNGKILTSHIEEAA